MRCLMTCPIRCPRVGCRVGGILLLVMEVYCSLKVRPEYSDCLKEGRGQVFTHTPLGLGVRLGVDYTDSGLLV